jgi:hypothetical protein
MGTVLAYGATARHVPGLCKMRRANSKLLKEFSMLTKVLKSLATLAGTLFLATAMAGPIVVSGDSNIADILDSNGGNQAFFNNVLGGGTSVAVLSTTPSLCCLGNADQLIVDHYNAQAGVSATLLGGPVMAGSLAAYDLFVVAVPELAFGAAAVAEISSFLTGGGTLFLLGDNGAFPGENGNLNALLVALGSAMQIENVTLNAGFNLAQIDAHPLTTGVAGMQYAAAGGVTGGTSLLRSLDGTTFAAVESYNVPEPGSLALITVSLLGLGLMRGRRQS